MPERNNPGASAVTVEYSSRYESSSSVELDSAKAGLFDEVLAVLHRSVETGFPPAFDCTIVDGEGPMFRAWGGVACRSPEGDVPLARDTLFDLASLTKVVGTTTATLALVDVGELALDDKVASILPDFARKDLTLLQLLSHTSGLIAHRPFFELGQDPDAIRAAVFAEAASGGPPGTALPSPGTALGSPGAALGSEVLYSDLNFMILGWALESATSMPLAELVRHLVTSPLAMTSTQYNPPASQREHTAATELNGDQRLTPELVWGEVHDGNAWALGGVAGHAGLFSTAEDLSRFVTALLRPESHPVLRRETISNMAVEQASSASDIRGIAWRLEPLEWGPWPVGTFWHTGFTGTSLLVAPELSCGVVLLSNAIHPQRDLVRQGEWRAEVHRAISRTVTDLRPKHADARSTGLSKGRSTGSATGAA